MPTTSPCVLASLFIVLLLLYPPSGCVCFRLGKRGKDVASINSDGASTAPAQVQQWKVPRLSKIVAEAMGHGGDSGTSVECHTADKLMQERGPDNYRKATAEYKLLLEKQPNSASLKFKFADASVSLLRSLTNANAVLIDGVSDSKENRKLWKAYAFEAYDILKELHAQEPQNARIHVLMTEAYTYRTSSKGILKAAVTGDGLTFMRLVDQIVSHHPTYDAGVPFIFRGAFLLAAPWPLRDVPKAVEAFESAWKVEPRSLRNNFFLGVSHFHAGSFEAARQAFERAVGKDVESVAATEVDVAEFLRRESRRSLEVTKERIAGGKA